MGKNKLAASKGIFTSPGPGFVLIEPEFDAGVADPILLDLVRELQDPFIPSTGRAGRPTTRGSGGARLGGGSGGLPFDKIA